MKFSKITLFKTELDNTYLNVIDGYNSYQEYYNFLRIAFDSIVIDLGDNVVKSVKENDGNLYITLKKNYYEINQYNYICLEFNGTYRFYFVDGIESQNDSDTNPSCSIGAELDCFTENYLTKLKNPNYNDVNLVSRRHMEECYISNNELLPIMYDTQEEMVETKLNLYSGYSQRVLWARVYTGREIEILKYRREINDVGYYWGNFEDAFKNCPSMSINNVLYMPLCVVNINGLGEPIVDKSIRECYLNSSYNRDTVIKVWDLIVQESQTPLDLDFMLKGITSMSSAVLKIELTYYAPFDWHLISLGGGNQVLFIENVYSNYIPSEDVTQEEIDEAIRLMNCAKFSGESSVLSEGVPLIVKNVEDVKNRANGEFLIYKVNKTSSNNYDEDIKCYEDFLSNQQADIFYKYSTDYNFNILAETRLKYYPYYFNTFLLNGNKIFVKPLEKDNYDSVRVDYKNRTNAAIKIGKSLEVDSMQPMLIAPTKNVILTIDSGNEYLKNNANSMVVGSITSMIPTLSISKYSTMMRLLNPFTGRMRNFKEETTNRQSITTNKTSLPSNISNYLDADNAVDEVKNYEDNAFNDLTSDIVLHAITNIRNESDKERLYYDFHYYGINIQKFLSLRENYHEIYDFVETENCQLPFIPNKLQRKTLENAYNNGITRWHMPNLTIVENGTIFNRNYINLSNVQREYYTIN